MVIESFIPINLLWLSGPFHRSKSVLARDKGKDDKREDPPPPQNNCYGRGWKRLIRFQHPARVSCSILLVFKWNSTAGCVWLLMLRLLCCRCSSMPNLSISYIKMQLYLWYGSPFRILYPRYICSIKIKTAIWWGNVILEKEIIKSDLFLTAAEKP